MLLDQSGYVPFRSKDLCAPSAYPTPKCCAAELEIDYPIGDGCESVPICGITDLECTLRQLLPSGAAWETPMGDPAICEPTFLKKFIELMSIHYGRIAGSAALLISQLNPTTAPDRSYWLNKWGLDQLIDFNAPLCDVQGLEFEGFQSTDECPVTDGQRAAVEYGLIRANIVTNRADFAPSLGNINLALRWLGYQIQPQTSKAALIVDRFGRLSYGVAPHLECCDGTLDFEPCEETECVPVNPCEISFGVEDCCRCKLQLRLAPICETLMAAPSDPCQPRGDDVSAICETIDTCTEPQTVIVRHIGATTAANFLRRVMPVWMPYDLEIIQ